MKIALVNPKTDVFEMRMLYDTHENLGIAQIASYLEINGQTVYLHDLRVDGLTENEAAKYIVENKFHIVGLSINYVTFPSAIEIAREIKLLNKDIVILFGGEHVSYQDKTVLEMYSDYVDYIIRGESENTFLDIVNTIENHNDIQSIQGISYICSSTNKVIQTQNRPPISKLDSLPHANRDIFKRAIANNKNIEIGILSQRGCPFQCSFCNANRFLSNEFKMIVRQRTPANVVNEMQELSRYIYDNRTFLRFYDATFITKGACSKSP